MSVLIRPDEACTAKCIRSLYNHIINQSSVAWHFVFFALHAIMFPHGERVSVTRVDKNYKNIIQNGKLHEIKGKRGSRGEV